MSSSLGSDDNEGTLEQPVRTLGKAFALALEGQHRVYACAELFPQAAEVPAGVELRGGLDCGDGWAYVGATQKTTIAPESPGVIALRVLAGDGASRVLDVHAAAAGGVEPGESSIAALVEPGAVVEIERCALVAGDGAAGVMGEQGGGEGAPERSAPATAATVGAVVSGRAADTGGNLVAVVLVGARPPDAAAAAAARAATAGWAAGVSEVRASGSRTPAISPPCLRRSRSRTVRAAKEDQGEARSSRCRERTGSTASRPTCRASLSLDHGEGDDPEGARAWDRGGVREPAPRLLQRELLGDVHVPAGP